MAVKVSCSGSTKLKDGTGLSTQMAGVVMWCSALFQEVKAG